MGESILLKILENCPDISRDWLYFGEGDMLVNQYNSFEYDNIDVTMVAEERIPYYKKDQSIPLYDTFGAAGCVSLFQNNHTNIPIDTIKIPDLPSCDGAIFIRGDSMYPILKSGDIVLYKTINSVEYIIWGETYIVCYESDGDIYTVVKYVKKADNQALKLTLLSQNEHHQPFDIYATQVKAIALVRASIRYNNM